MCKSGSVDKLGWLQNRVLLEERYCMGETERRKQFDHQKTVCFNCFKSIYRRNVIYLNMVPVSYTSKNRMILGRLCYIMCLTEGY